MPKFEESAWFKKLETASKKLPKTKSLALNGIIYGAVIVVVMIVLLSLIGGFSSCVSGTFTSDGSQSQQQTTTTDDPTGVDTLDGIKQRISEKATVVEVLTGDSIKVELADGKGSGPIRLIGVDTDDPTDGTDGVAKKKLQQLLPEGTEIWMTGDTSNSDKQGRHLRYVWLEDPRTTDDIEPIDSMVNAIIIDRGWGVVKDCDPDTKYSELLHQIEDGKYKEGTFAYNDGSTDYFKKADEKSSSSSAKSATDDKSNTSSKSTSTDDQTSSSTSNTTNDQANSDESTTNTDNASSNENITKGGSKKKLSITG